MLLATVVTLKNLVFAHAVGQPPYFKVDGIFTDYYPVPLGSTHFEIPNDIASGKFTAGKPINFEIETTVLGIPQKVVDVSTFYWDFGDGTTGKGLKNTHTYQKPGSYFQKIEVTYPEITGNQILQTTLINITDDQTKELPNVKIAINGKKINDPLTDVSFIPSGQQVELTADLENENNATFSWDLGNGETSTEKTVMTTYQKDQYREQFFPIVRVRTESGFYTDAYAQITTNKELKQGGQPLVAQNQKSNIPKVALATLVATTIIAAIFLKLKRKK